VALVTLLAVFTAANYAATPENAAMNALYIGPNGTAAIARVNRSGAYAAVLVKGARMEGVLVDAPVLVQRFSFGWQPIDVLNFRCRLEAHDLGLQVETTLMEGMPKPVDDRPCHGLRDTGPSAKVEAVRYLMRGPLVPYVVVAGDWAIGSWYGAGGGETLYRYQSLDKRTGWGVIASGGGALDTSDMRAFGVPPSDWCKFGIYNAACR
jgi:hypothetical protein